MRYALIFGCFLSLIGTLPAATVYVTTSADSGLGSLRQAVLDAADGDYIQITSAVYDQPIRLSSPILIDKGLVIDGDRRDRVVIDGRGLTRLFIVEAPGRFVNLKQLTLTGGRCLGSGGAIVNQYGFLRLEGVHLIGNVAQTQSAGQGGGAVHNLDSLQVSGSLLRDNQAAGSFGSGGAILNGSGADARISSNSRLVHNYASERGGAIASLAGSYLSLRHVSLDSNAVGQSGGALALLGGICGMYIGSISHNRAPQEGGAIYIEGADCTLRRVELTGNTADGTGGGGIFARGSNSFVQLNPGTVLDSNRATHPASIGGGLAVVEEAKLRMNSARLRSNVANAAGGGLAFISSNPAYGSRVGGRFEGNRVEGSQGVGGAVYIFTDEQVAVGGRFTNNYATVSGGGIWTNAPSMSLSDDTFEDNGCGGGGVDQGGGAIFNLRAHISLRNTVFRRNYAQAPESSGGAILTHRGGIQTKESHVFTDNSCGLRGGAVCLLTGDYNFGRTTFENNTAHAPGGSGGAIYAGGFSLRMRNSWVRANSAHARGGGVWASAATYVDMQDCNVIDNLIYGLAPEESGGGGLYVAGGKVRIVQSTIGRNAALQRDNSHGGGLLVRGTNTVTNLRLSTVVDNSATGSGGGVYSQRAFLIGDVTLSGNQAAHGGGYAQEGGEITELSGSILAANYGSRETNDIALTAATFSSGGFNMLGQRLPEGVLRSVTDTVSDRPMLGPLTDNGGKTLTRRPLVGSPVINAGRFTDRRGDIDQIDQPPAGGRREIGALEVLASYFFADPDGDGYGDPDNPSELVASAPAGYVSDNTDNCPNDYNPAQTDTDGDGVGDVCQSD
jgi:predicted outer membrane repeat protein